MALDFGMALSKGLVAPQKELQAEVRKLAGDQFKSEEWWNKQLDRQIKEGIKETKTKKQILAVPNTIFGGQPYWADDTGMSPLFGGPRAYKQSMFDPVQTRTVQYEEQKDLTSEQLKAIQTQAEETTRKAKRAAAQSKKGKRGARGSSGLMGRSDAKDVGLATGLPALGSLGLGIGQTKLG